MSRREDWDMRGAWLLAVDVIAIVVGCMLITVGYNATLEWLIELYR